MTAGVTLITERLTLRRLSDADIPAIVAGINDYDVSKWLTVVPYPYSEADAREFLGFLDTGPALEGFGIHAPEGLVGVVGIGKTLGYWLARTAHGKGYMTEAAGALVGHYFDTTDAARLQSGYFVGNAASKNVLTKLGFVPDGEEQAMSVSQGIEVTLKKVALTREGWTARHGG
ncbi:MAG: GNAT family N-acetyltransferase [Maritimibacter sp.]